MSCKKYTLINSGSTIVNFNYRRCDDQMWQYQVELEPNQTKNIWVFDDTLSIAELYRNLIILEDDGDFPISVTPTPTPTLTPGYQPESPTPTPSVTPTITPTITNTPTVTPTASITPTPTTNRNLIIENTSSNNYIINLVDDSGTWFLTDQVGSFIVGPGSMLYANHDTTNTNPRCTITYNGTYTFQVRINGVLTSDWSGSGSGAGLSRVLRTLSPSTPIDASETVYIKITD